MSQDYDKDLINREVIAVCDHYLTDRKGEGKRQTYLCPACGDRNFEVDPERGYAGCFDAGCEAPTTTDALGVLAYFEGTSLSGEGFVMCLKKGYEILGIADPPQQRSESANGDRQKAMTARKQRKGSHREKAMTPRADRGGEDEVPGNGHNGVHSSGPQWGAATSSPVETSESALLEQPIQAWQENEDGTTVPVAAVVIREQETEPDAEAEDGAELEDAELAEKLDRQTDRTDERQTAHEVFEELLKLCRREERDERFLTDRGLDEETIKEGRFGSISKSRCNYVVGKLRKKFSEEELLAVPGFHRTEGGQLRFSLYGDYALIPYFDNEGYIRTVEGRFTGEEMGEYDKKYKALLNSAVHLYVHPRFNPDEVVAICEGAIGAMVAARYGFAVASIKGFRNYRTRVDGDGNLYTVLPELEGVDFAGKTVVYIPDVDVKPASYESVMKTVPDACHWMIERQGGVPKVAMLPEGAKDLDAWILSLEEDEREEKMEELLGEAIPVEQFKQHCLANEHQPDLSDNGSRDGHAGDSVSPTSESSGSGNASEDGAEVDSSPGDEFAAGDSDTGSSADEKPRAHSSNQRQIFGEADRPTGDEEQSGEGSERGAEQQPLDGFMEKSQEQGETSRKYVSGEDRTDEHPGSNRREYGTGSGKDEEPEKETGKQRDEGREGGEDNGEEQTDSAQGAGPSPDDSNDNSEEDDTSEMETITYSVTDEPDYHPEPAAFEVTMKGEWALATVVYVAATVVLTILIHVLTSRYIGWVELPVWWELGLAAFIAIWVTVGFRELRKKQKAMSMRRHIEGTD